MQTKPKSIQHRKHFLFKPSKTSIYTFLSIIPFPASPVPKHLDISPYQKQSRRPARFSPREFRIPAPRHLGFHAVALSVSPRAISEKLAREKTYAAHAIATRSRGIASTRADVKVLEKCTRARGMRARDLYYVESRV